MNREDAFDVGVPAGEPFGGDGVLAMTHHERPAVGWGLGRERGDRQSGEKQEGGGGGRRGGQRKEGGEEGDGGRGTSSSLDRKRLKDQARVGGCRRILVAA